MGHCDDVERVTTLAQTSLVKLKEKLPESTQLIDSSVPLRGDKVDQKHKELNAHCSSVIEMTLQYVNRTICYKEME